MGQRTFFTVGSLNFHFLRNSGTNIVQRRDPHALLDFYRTHKSSFDINMHHVNAFEMRFCNAALLEGNGDRFWEGRARSVGRKDLCNRPVSVNWNSL